jgi:dTDP-glucose 4,6-dehydratase
MDIASDEVETLIQDFDIDYIVNFAAETHVDRSILDPNRFLQTNILGTQNLLEIARRRPHTRLLHISTDEVYGSLSPEDPTFTEHSPLMPSSPYAASKASGDLMALAAHHTYGQDVLITRCSNNFGPFQFPEKLLPLLIANAMEDKPIPVYGDGKQVRDWLFVKDHCRAVDLVLMNGRAGTVYNISGNEEHPNIEVIKKVLDLLGKPHSLIEHVKDRPGHDRRYGLNASRIIEELGWKRETPFTIGLEKTISWYQQNQQWWTKIRNKDFYRYYDANYSPKMKARAEGLPS